MDIEKNINLLKDAIKQNTIRVINNQKNEIAKNINKYCENSDFYTLSTDVIKEIIDKTNINENNDIDTICKLLNNASKYEENASLLLSCFKPQKLTFDECIKILSSLINVPICLKLGELYKQTKEDVIEIDWDYELKEKEQKIRELEYKLIEYKEPDDFEGDIFKAVEKNNIKSVKYLIKVKKVDPNINNNIFGYTPLHIASLNGHLDIVKYLVEECKTDPNIKNIENGSTPLHYASYSGHPDIVKYLVGECKLVLILRVNMDLLHYILLH